MLCGHRDVMGAAHLPLPTDSRWPLVVRWETGSLTTVARGASDVSNVVLDHSNAPTAGQEVTLRTPNEMIFEMVGSLQDR